MKTTLHIDYTKPDPRWMATWETRFRTIFDEDRNDVDWACYCTDLDLFFPTGKREEISAD